MMLYRDVGEAVAEPFRQTGRGTDDQGDTSLWSHIRHQTAQKTCDELDLLRRGEGRSSELQDPNGRGTIRHDAGEN